MRRNMKGKGRRLGSKKYSYVNLSWPGLPVVYLPCPHQHLKAGTVDRKTIDREQHINLLSTPKGYRWDNPQDNKKQLCPGKSSKKKLLCIEPPEKQQCKSNMDDIWKCITPDLLEKLMSIFVNDFQLSKNEATDFINEQKDYSKAAQKMSMCRCPCAGDSDNQYIWMREFTDLIGCKLRNQIGLTLCSWRTKRQKMLMELVVNCMSDISGENINIACPETRMQKIMVFAADRMALWLDRMLIESDKQIAEEDRMDSEQIESEQAEKRKKEEDDRRKKEDEEKKSKDEVKAAEAEAAAAAAAAEAEAEATAKAKAEEAAAEEAAAAAAAAEEPGAEKAAPAETGADEAATAAAEAEKAATEAAEAKAASEAAEAKAASEAAEAKAASEAAEAEKAAAAAAEAEKAAGGATEAEKAAAAAAEAPTSEEEAAASEEPAPPEEAASEEPTAAEEAVTEEAVTEEAVTEAGTDEAVAEGEEEIAEGIPEESEEAKGEEVEIEFPEGAAVEVGGAAPADAGDNAMNAIVDWIKDTDVVKTDRQQKISKVVKGKLADRLQEYGDVEGMGTAIDSLSKQVSTWVDKLASGAEKEMKAQITAAARYPAPKGVLYHIKRGSDNYFKVRQVSCTDVASRKTRIDRPMTSDDVKDFTKWAEDLIHVSDAWTRWVENAFCEAYTMYNRNADKPGELSAKEFDSWRERKRKEAIDWKRAQKSIYNRAKKWEDWAKFTKNELVGDFCDGNIGYLDDQ